MLQTNCKQTAHAGRSTDQPLVSIALEARQANLGIVSLPGYDPRDDLLDGHLHAGDVGTGRGA